MSRSLIDLALTQRHETEAAYLVTEDGLKAVWIPKSQVERGDALGQGAYTFAMPEWLATEKGFI